MRRLTVPMKARFLFVTLLVTLLTGGLLYAQTDPQPLLIDLSVAGRNGGAVVMAPGGNYATVTIALTGGECPAVERHVPVDVVLVIDASGSMDDSTSDGLTKLDATIAAARTFLTRLNFDANDPASDQAALVAFNSNADTLSGLTRDSATLSGLLGTLSADGGTTIAAGINAATTILAGPDHNFAYNASPVIILLTDGQDSPSEVRRAAEQARRQINARIVTIGLGQPGDVDQDLLRDIADTMNGQPLAYFTANASDLNAIYDTVANLIIPHIAASNLTLTYRLNMANVSLVDGSITQGGVATSTDTITWTYGELLSGDTAEFRFEVEVNQAGPIQAGSLDVVYLPCEQTVERSDNTTGPSINVQLPTPTFTPSNTPTATPTSTPTVTPTATPNAVLRPPEPSTPPTEPGVTTDFCQNSLLMLWILPLLLALLLGLLLLALLYWLLVRRPNRTWRESPCFLLFLLFWLVVLFVLFALLQPITGQFCFLGESVYFWRMTGPQSGIFLVNPDGGEPAQVTSLNQRGCVGCHTVSNSARQVAAIDGPPGLAITNFDGTLPETALPNVDAMYLSYSPDGTQLAATTDQAELVIIDLATGTVTPVSGSTDAQYGAVMPVWHPDGSRIAYVRARRDQIDVGIVVNYESSIVEIPVTGGTPVDLVGPEVLAGLNYYPSYSPDGTWLAFTHHDNPGGNSYADWDADIWLYNTQTRQAQPIAANSPDASDSWPTWNSDGTRLAFNTTAVDASFDIALVDVAPDGTTSAAVLLQGASEPGVFEHLPFWGTPIDQEALGDQLADRLPLLLLPLLCLLPLLLLCWLLNRTRPEPVTPEETPLQFRAPPEEVGPIQLAPWRGIEALWKPRPTLIIGLGKPGWHVLTQIKKTLNDVSLGAPSENVPLMCVLTQSEAQKESDLVGGMMLDEDDEVLYWTQDLRPILEQASDDPALRDWLPESLQTSTLDPTEGLEAQRVLGRAALVNNLRGDTGAKGRHFWQWLQERAQKAVGEQNRLRVIVVADISDDTGSGSFQDVAYLVKRLKDKLNLGGDVRVIGHLITDRAAQGKASDRHRRVNTLAALRELGRFQLAVAPFPVEFGVSDETAEDIEGEWKLPIFDEVFVYDGERRAAILDPKTAVYPAIADLIALWLDTATREGDLDKWRQSRLRVTDDAQRRAFEVMVGSMGIYQYRLPFTDLLEDITVKYALQIVKTLLIGNAAGEPSWENAKASEVFVKADESGGDLAYAFLRDRFGSSDFDDDWRRLLVALSTNDQQGLERQLGKIDPAKAEDEKWTEWLHKAVLVLLNGRQEKDAELDVQRKRGAKLKLVRDFLRALSDQQRGFLKQMMGRIEQQSPSHPAAERLESFRKITEEIYTTVDDIGLKLGMGARTDSLYGQLRQRYYEIEQQWKALENLETREYITETPAPEGRPLRDVWYETYLQGKVIDALKPLYWRFEDGQPVLVLESPEREDTADTPTEYVFDPEDLEGFKAGLLEIGRYFAQDVRTHENLAQALDRDQLDDVNIEMTSRELIEKCWRLLGVNENALVPETQVGLILSANTQVEKADALAKLMRSRLNNVDLLRLNTSDPFSLTLVQTIDTVPLDSIRSVEIARQSYLEDDMPRLLYGAEVTARDYEQRLPLIQFKPRVFNPVVVTALARRAQAEAFLLLAAVRQELTVQRGSDITANPAETGKLELLNTRAMNDSTRGWLIDALLAFSQQVSDEDAQAIIERYSLDEELLEVLDAWEQGEYEAWYRDFAGSEQNRPIYDDLIAITRLLIISLFDEE